MLYVLAFYWLVCGLAFYALPTSMGHYELSVWLKLRVFLGCMAIGGIGIPVRLVLKAVL